MTNERCRCKVLGVMISAVEGNGVKNVTYPSFCG